MFGDRIAHRHCISTLTRANAPVGALWHSPHRRRRCLPQPVGQQRCRSHHPRLRIRHIIDFIPGQEPYPNDIVVEFEPHGDQVTMVVHIDPHMSDEMTAQSRESFESQLTKIPALLEARRKA